jgi:hypothetical protein
VFFRRIFVGAQGIAAVELADQFGALLREDLATEVERLLRTPRLPFARGVRTVTC